MDAERLAYAFSAGMVAVLNPCGFPLLPAYLTYYLGTDSADGVDRPHRALAVARSLGVGGAITAGFMLVFGLIGSLWSSLSSVLGQRTGWITLTMGVLLLALGVSMLAGFQPALRLPKLDVRKGGRQLSSAFVFGLSYGVASLSCTIPVFLAVMGGTFSAGFGEGVSTFATYAVGMGALVTLLTLSVALARGGLVRALRRALPYISRVSGAFVMVSGVVVAFYGWGELQVFRGDEVNGVYARVQNFGTSLQELASKWDTWLGLTAAAMAAGACAWWWIRRGSAKLPARDLVPGERRPALPGCVAERGIPEARP